MTRRVALTAHVQPTVKKAIEAFAKDDGRSAGQYVERILTAHIASKTKRRKSTQVRPNRSK